MKIWLAFYLNSSLLTVKGNQRTLRGYSVHQQSSTINTSIKTVSKCGDIRCGTCPFLKQGSSIDFRGKRFRINSDMSFQSKNLIYTIICDGCNQFYIGETGTALRTRIRCVNNILEIQSTEK